MLLTNLNGFSRARQNYPGSGYSSLERRIYLGKDTVECSSMAKRIGIIPGSTRPNANSSAFAAWVHHLVGDTRQGFEYEVVHIGDFKLPLLDEPGVPAWTGPTLEHSKAWSAKVASLDGFIFVTPQACSPDAVSSSI